MTVNLKNFLNPKSKNVENGRVPRAYKRLKDSKISSISADLYGDGRDDLTLFYFHEGANFGAIYTQYPRLLQLV